MSNKRRRDPNPFDALETVQLHDVPNRNSIKDFIARVFSRPSDYEIILAQSYRIAYLERLLEGKGGDN